MEVIFRENAGKKLDARLRAVDLIRNNGAIPLLTDRTGFRADNMLNSKYSLVWTLVIDAGQARTKSYTVISTL